MEMPSCKSVALFLDMHARSGRPHCRARDRPRHPRRRWRLDGPVPRHADVVPAIRQGLEGGIKFEVRARGVRPPIGLDGAIGKEINADRSGAPLAVRARPPPAFSAARVSTEKTIPRRARPGTRRPAQEMAAAEAGTALGGGLHMALFHIVPFAYFTFAKCSDDFGAHFRPRQSQCAFLKGRGIDHARHQHGKTDHGSSATRHDLIHGFDVVIFQATAQRIRKHFLREASIKNPCDAWWPEVASIHGRCGRFRRGKLAGGFNGLAMVLVPPHADGVKFSAPSPAGPAGHGTTRTSAGFGEWTMPRARSAYAQPRQDSILQRRYVRRRRREGAKNVIEDEQAALDRRGARGIGRHGEDASMVSTPPRCCPPAG